MHKVINTFNLDIIFISINKNDLHYYQFSTTYRVLKQLKVS